jgi:hypothetical protein
MPISNLVRCQGILAGARDSHPSLFEPKCPFITFGHVLTFDMPISYLVRFNWVLR